MSMMLRYWYRLYNNMTPAERALEPAIAALGERYRAQHPFLGQKLFADFALLDRQRIIEVDGDSHDKPSQMKKDAEHELALTSLGWSVIRVTNEQAQANPVATVTAALSATPRTPAELTRVLERLRFEYPKLFEPKPTKSRKPRRKVKGRAAGTGARARRKPPAS